jgi:hypothetical protein
MFFLYDLQVLKNEYYNLLYIDHLRLHIQKYPSFGHEEISIFLSDSNILFLDIIDGISKVG